MIKMISWASTGLTGLAFASFLGLAHGQESSQETRSSTRTTTEVRRVSEIVGSKVTLQENVELGKIEDVVLTDGGCVDYLVVSYDEKYVLVPYNVTRIDYRQRVVSVEITRDRFQQIPTFTREKWPNLADAQYTQKIRTFYGEKGNGASRSSQKEGDSPNNAEKRDKGDKRSSDKEQRQLPRDKQPQTDPQQRDSKPGASPGRNSEERPSRQNQAPKTNEDQPKSKEQPTTKEGQPKPNDKK